MDGKYPIFIEILAGVVRAINRGHVMRIIEEQGEPIKGNRPCKCAGDRREVSQQQKRNRPGAATYDQVEPRRVNPYGSSSGRALRVSGHRKGSGRRFETGFWDPTWKREGNELQFSPAS